MLGGHLGSFATGTVASRKGLLMGGADSFRITLRGQGAHASRPDLSLDPVLSAAHATVRLQTLVSRTVSPLSRGAVVTVASIRAGYGENVIPDSAELKVDTRSSDPAMKRALVDGVRRIVTAESLAAGLPSPDIERLREFPILANHPAAVDTLAPTMQEHFGHMWSDDAAVVSASEDFPILATAVNRPYVFWWYGGYSQGYLDRMEREGKASQIPYNHSPFFAPVIQPTLKMGVDAYAVAALAWLANGSRSL